MPSVGVVIVAGGKGMRMGGALPKQFMILDQKPVLAHVINIFAKTLRSADIVVVLPSDHIEYWTNLSSRFSVAPHKVVAGGEERFHSVKCGIDALKEDVDLIAVHDGVRPLCSQELIERCVKEATRNFSAIPVVEVVDSFRRVDGLESEVVDRKSLRAVQTPQVFDAPTLKRAYRCDFKVSFTDDASVVEAWGGSLHLCEGERQNIKITTVEDLAYAQLILDSYEESL